MIGWILATAVVTAVAALGLRRQENRDDFDAHWNGVVRDGCEEDFHRDGAHAPGFVPTQRPAVD